MNPQQRSRSWCLTINNYNEEDIKQLKEIKYSYIIIGDEKGEQGTPHLQIYIEFDDAKSFQFIKKKTPTAHIEQAKGNPQQNRDYCSKDKIMFEDGKIKSQGKRTDLDEIKNDIMAGKKVDDIVLEKPIVYHQYGRTLTKIEDLRMRKVFRNFQTLGEWIYGTTGTGKSEYAFKDFSPDTHYVWKYDNGWNDGYNQQETVIIDEFRGQLPMWELLTMIDKHPNYYVKRRGKEPLPFVSKKVIITSSMPPSEVYHNLNDNDKLEQLNRRIIIKELTKN